MDDLTSITFVLVWGKGRRGRGRGATVRVSGELPPLQAMAKAIRDVAKAVRDEVPPLPLPPPPRREVSSDLGKAKF